MKNLRIMLLAFLFISVSLAHSTELENLVNAKNRVRQYYQSGQYENDLTRIIDSAIVEFDKLPLKPNSAVVFDIDETTLSNMPYEIKYDFGFERKTWDEWIDSAKALAIPQTQKLYHYLMGKNVKIIFITGRPDKQYEKTYKNLTSQSYIKFDTLICKSSIYSGKKAVEYKSNVRKALSEKYDIIGSVGDQYSDMEGGYTVLKIKLPNYMYFIE